MADIVSGSSTTTDSLSINSFKKGTIDTSDDSDWYQVDLIKGVVYKFELKGLDGGGGSLIDPLLVLYNLNSTVLRADNDGTATFDTLVGHTHDSQIVFIAQESGVYYLAAAGFKDTSGNARTGSFTLSSSTLSSDYYIQAILTQPDNPRWNANQALATPITITYSFPVTKPTDFGSFITNGFVGMAAAQQATVRAALKDIEALVNIRFQEVSGADGSIRFAGTNQGVDSSGVTFNTQISNLYTQSDIAFNNANSNLADLRTGSYMYPVLVHEIGHALGLKHPGNYYGVYSAPYLPSSQDASPYTIESYNHTTNYLGITDKNGYLYSKSMMAFDIAALQYLYGANSSTNSGNDNYKFDPKSIYSIWDSGGIDIIDASTATTSVTLDLGQGTISYIGYVGFDTLGKGLVPSLSIAFGALIENSSGGPYNDLLLGNATLNNINGGDGDDRIEGFEGDDIFNGGSGNDTIYGGSGVDTSVYSSNRANYTLTKNLSNFTISSSVEGTDTLTDVEHLTFSDVTLPTNIDLFVATKGTAVGARGAVDVASAIATQLSVVYLGRPADKTLLLELKTALGNDQPSAAVLTLIASKAIQDGAFAASDTSKDIVVHTFKNIMGFLPSDFEQTEWAKYIDNGALTKVNAPWIIFQSYLGANNVPDVYKLPTQARFVAAQTFSDYAFLDYQQAGLASLNSIYAKAAREWLAPVDSVDHAASKMQTMIADIESVTLTGVAPVDTFIG